ncbi:putative membrane protein [Bacillus anthracis]|nr:putative membrane protein [Bacillus anthracis]
MAILSNIGTALFLIAFILLILCIISFFKKNGKAKQYGRPAVILFMISIVLIITSAETANNPIVEFFSILSFVLFVFFLVLAILSVIKKTGVAKNNLLSLLFYLLFLVRYQVFQTLLLKKRQQLVNKLHLTMQNKKIARRKKN